MTGPIHASWHPAGWADAMPHDEPVRVSALDVPVVIAKIGGQWAAMDDRCPHRGTSLALGTITDHGLRCPYHGWEFDGDARCIAVPSLGSSRRLGPQLDARPFAVHEAHGLVWVNLDADADPASIPDFPTESTDGMTTVRGPVLSWQTSAGRHVENVLDVAHFPFVHAATFGDTASTEIAPYRTDTTEDDRTGAVTVSAELDVDTVNPPSGTRRLFASFGERIPVHYRYEVTLPYRVSIIFTFPEGVRRELHEAVRPNGPDRCTIFWALRVDERLGSDPAEELASALRVRDEDQHVIESQPPGVPVDPSSEPQVPADRLAVAYRTALRRWGVPEGATV